MIVGVGLDLVDIERVARLLSRRRDQVTARLFTSGEAAYAEARPEPARHFAARLAAKEAAFKALAGNPLARGIGWRELEVVSSVEDGRPSLAFHGRAESRAAELGVTRSWVTLSHSHGLAAAVVILERD